jgi:hypothetical protein
MPDQGRPSAPRSSRSLVLKLPDHRTRSGQERVGVFRYPGADCKKIRTEQGSWQQMETYISNQSDAKFTHGLCPDCARRYREELERDR